MPKVQHLRTARSRAGLSNSVSQRSSSACSASRRACARRARRRPTSPPRASPRAARPPPPGRRSPPRPARARSDAASARLRRLRLRRLLRLRRRRPRARGALLAPPQHLGPAAVVGVQLAVLDRERPLGDRVEQRAVVRDEQHGARERLERRLERLAALEVEMVRRLVEHEEVRARRDRRPRARAAGARRPTAPTPASRARPSRRRGSGRAATARPAALSPVIVCTHWSTEPRVVELHLLLREVGRARRRGRAGSCRRRVARPSIVSSSVVLPEPFGPTSATCSPRSSANDASSQQLACRRCRSVEPLDLDDRRARCAPASGTRSRACACAATAARPRRPPRRAPSRAARSASASPAPASPCPSSRGTARRSARAARCPAWTRSTSFCACSARAAFSRRHACHGPGKKVARPAVELERRRRHRLEEPAVVRDEDHRRVERLQLALEPLEARDVEMVRRLVEQQQVGVAAERARERGARQLAAGERRAAAGRGRSSAKPRPRTTDVAWSRQP